jgi:hypothetical protein
MIATNDLLIVDLLLGAQDVEFVMLIQPGHRVIVLKQLLEVSGSPLCSSDPCIRMLGQENLQHPQISVKLLHIIHHPVMDTNIHFTVTHEGGMANSINDDFDGDRRPLIRIQARELMMNSVSIRPLRDDDRLSLASLLKHMCDRHTDLLAQLGYTRSSRKPAHITANC